MGALDYLKDRRISGAIAIILILAILDFKFGGPTFLHFGIEFVGGTQIPISLEHGTTPTQMSNIISIIQQRVSTFGLKQVTVEGVGTSTIYVTVPSVSASEINQTINIIESQGVFQGVVDGVEALNGSSILSGSIGTAPPITSGANVSWAVDFFLTEQGVSKFARVAYGKAYMPLYMFLDRPTRSILLLNSSLLSAASNYGLTKSDAIQAMQNALLLGNSTIPLQLIDGNSTNWNALQTYFNTSRKYYGKVILGTYTPNSIISALKAMNYTLVIEAPANLTPTFETIQGTTGSVTPAVLSWSAVGMLYAPVLQPGVTNGTSGSSYQITGGVPANLSVNAKIGAATNESKKVASILSGGALPAKVLVGNPTVIPATLGTQFLYASVLAAVFAVLAVAAIIALRYKHMFLVLPIIITVLGELFIIVSIIGLLGTIDLSAVAGMIAVVGTGVDDQIVITDEITNTRDNSTIKTKLRSAFYVIWVDAVLLIIAMLPLLFSTSLVTVIGFAESTILGALLGVMITRPAYAAMLSHHYFKGEKVA